MNKLRSIFGIILFMTICHGLTARHKAGVKVEFTGLSNKPDYFDEEVRSRLETMSCLVTPKIDDDVLDQVRRFVGKNKAHSLEIIRRTEIYFPLIDKIFKEYNLPIELKYVTIVESSLLLDAKSNVGAAGIWQLMPATARILKLRVDDKVDQRLDPVLATYAAAKYFTMLYGMFNDWSLAIAAYNCGEYKIKAIVENSNAKDFWELKKFLPRQTQLFVPAFIGASYLMQFYQEHDIISDGELENAEKITFAKIYKEVNLKDLYKKTNITKALFMSLNPSFKKGIIQQMTTGSSISLPDSLMVEFIEYYVFGNKKNNFFDEARILLTGEDLNRHEIISFNRPFIFAPDNIALTQVNEINLEFESNSIRDIRVIPQLNSISELDFKYHLIKSRESISEIADYYKVDLEDLISWNQINTKEVLKAGTVLKVRN